MYGLIDGNNFYVSCERVFAPRLVGKPVVVLSSNDGACIARSNEAKEIGVKMAQPWFQVKHLERSAGLIAVSANHELYGDMSARMMDVEARYAPRQEVYSVDESFLDFTGVCDDLMATGKAMRAAILQETGLPTSVGFGATKTLAKLANHIGKTADRKPGLYPAHLAQVCDFGRLQPQELDALFAATEVGNVWGVGKKITEKLKAGGIHTVLDLMRADSAQLRAQFSVTLEKTLLELRGTSCMEVDDAPAPRQQILVSRSFGTAITNVEGIIEACSEFVSRAAERLRGQGSLAGAVGIFFTTSPFRQNDRQHSVNVTVPLVRPTADSAVLVSAAAAAVRAHFRHGFNYAKAGAVLTDLRPVGQEQGELDLFSSIEQEAAAHTEAARAKLMTAMDALNHRFGRDSVRLGSTAAASSRDEIRVWATKQERRSPRYTTRWDEMLVVRA
ncbi:Y-family DNA polymerase [Scleromatobacter humisilvae]|uniref:Y-family DNA polymerase n=1 Tax=Scleromatobacter humisilvae TaxID=2897159 RepID=A0A9X1YMY3_9BURK|nr:Y-family DNA polymerase [Scleromatobacter humisilvae]MCK9687337.1 Y-family DNA polymerase [Scleromatobacter humisilvae]